MCSCCAALIFMPIRLNRFESTTRVQQIKADQKSCIIPHGISCNESVKRADIEVNVKPQMFFKTYIHLTKYTTVLSENKLNAHHFNIFWKSKHQNIKLLLTFLVELRMAQEFYDEKLPLSSTVYIMQSDTTGLYLFENTMYSKIL